MNGSLRFRALIMLIGMVCVSGSTIANATIVVSDNFESYTTTDVIWPTPGDPDADPATTPQGQSWTIVEFSAPRANIVSHPNNLPAAPSTSPSFAAASGTKYLHLFRSNTGGGQAWLDFTAADQSLMAANNNLRISAKVFALSGHDSWNGNISITAFDSAAVVGTNLAFDVNARDGGYGLSGFINTSTNRTSGTPTTIADQVNVWQNLTIDVNFLTDTYTITLDAQTPLTLSLPTNLSKISSLMFAAGDIGLSGNWRGGIDDLLVTVAVPEPTTITILGPVMALLGLPGIRRRWTFAR